MANLWYSCKHWGFVWPQVYWQDEGLVMARTTKRKSKSTVNKAGNYTKPTMRKRLFNKILAGDKGGKKGQWSARKAQMLAKQYKASGGGYKS